MLQQSIPWADRTHLAWPTLINPGACGKGGSSRSSVSYYGRETSCTDWQRILAVSVSQTGYCTVVIHLVHIFILENGSICCHVVLLSYLQCGEFPWGQTPPQSNGIIIQTISWDAFFTYKRFKNDQWMPLAISWPRSSIFSKAFIQLFEYYTK